MQIRWLAYDLECVSFCFCILHDIKIITTKFCNSTPKCSPKTVAPLLYISGPAQSNTYTVIAIADRLVSQNRPYTALWGRILKLSMLVSGVISNLKTKRHTLLGHFETVFFYVFWCNLGTNTILTWFRPISSVKINKNMKTMLMHVLTPPI